MINDYLLSKHFEIRSGSYPPPTHEEDMPEILPPWLSVMRGLTGLTEAAVGDNPKILRMAKAVGAAWPDQAHYAATYTHDSIPWCGLCVAYVMTMAGIKPANEWMWALNWKSEWPQAERISKPRLGCVVVMRRSGGGHVTLYEGTLGRSYRCRGGNQSDMVNVSSYPIANVVALMWPKAKPEAQRMVV